MVGWCGGGGVVGGGGGGVKVWKLFEKNTQTVKKMRQPACVSEPPNAKNSVTRLVTLFSGGVGSWELGIGITGGFWASDIRGKTGRLQRL